MKRITALCEHYHIALCYLFGSQMDAGKSLLETGQVSSLDPESDIDIAVLFKKPPQNSLDTYARLSLDLQDLMAPCKVDLLFLHEVDHLLQLEAVMGSNVYSIDEMLRDEYEERVMKFAADELQIFKRNERDFFGAVKDGYFEFEYKAA